MHAGWYSARLETCPFCVISLDRVTLETEHAIAFSDGYPVVQGHTLVIPRLHVASIIDLAPVVKTAVWIWLRRSEHNFSATCTQTASPSASTTVWRRVRP
jgi:diadenosine tetraphosphate (Ap4A) HIT family hydrolase